MFCCQEVGGRKGRAMKLISVQSRGNRLVRMFSESTGHSVYGKMLMSLDANGFINTIKTLAWPVSKKKAFAIAEEYLRGATK